MDNFVDENLTAYENAIHDIRGPMTIIYTYAQLLEVTKKMPPSALEHIQTMKRNCFKALKIITDVSDSSKIRDGYFLPNFANTNIVQLVKNVVESTQPFTVRKNVELIFSKEFDEKIMATDKTLVERVLLNLLSNSVKHVEKGGFIKVSIKNSNEFLEISVEDNGKGIKAEVLPHIFERYHTGDSIRGKGIGLSIVREIVEVLGGSINAMSEEGKGTKMTVNLPIFLLDKENDKPKFSDDFYVDNMVQIELSDEFY
ncbi:MAG: HAMP domain-containing histidine kinase [Defluviitaleaceae bacterium]|nr:HAMP domain-containing histidine kinase [Defluviitaleaceae bacterium]